MGENKDNNNLSKKGKSVMLVISILILSIAFLYFVLTSDYIGKIFLSHYYSKDNLPFVTLGESDDVSEDINIEESEDYIDKNRDIREKADSYPRSFVGNELTEMPDSKNGYYECIGTLYYNHNNRWFTFTDGRWKYERIVGACLENLTSEFFTSEEYQDWMADVYGAYAF